VIILFLNEVERIAKIFKEMIKSKHVRIYAQFDADGITSASIIIKTIIRLGGNFELRILKQLNSKTANEINFNEGDFLIFLDMGSGQINILKSVIEKASVLIIDHHEPTKYEHHNLLHLNPILFGEDPERYSTSIITFIFSKYVDSRNIDLVDLAIVGAVGDGREKNIKYGIIAELLEEARELGLINIVKDLKFIGFDKPLFKVLAYSTDPFLPNIYGNEAAAIQFLLELGINVKNGEEWRKLNNLSEEEKIKLADGIIKEKFGIIDYSEIFEDIFILLKRPEFLSDSREFSTLVNACSRLGNSEISLRLCLGDYSIYTKVLENIEEYRKQIAKSISLIENGKIIEKENGIFILGGNDIPDTLIGTILSILLNSKNLNKPIFGLAYDEVSNMIKVSARKKRIDNLNLREILLYVANEIGGEAGGHKDAAGAYIPCGKEKEFIDKINFLIGEMNAKK
jgi:single-stranded-DNA-specific exonuclease